MSQQSHKSLEQRIYERLKAEIQPETLTIINQSHLHKGHEGDDGTGESHFRIEISAEKLNKLSYVERERAIHQALIEEMQQIHAISIRFIKS